LESAAEKLAELDPTWRARFSLVLESYSEDPSPAAKRLSSMLVRQAAAAIDFPRPADASIDTWIRARIAREWTTAVQLAPLAISLLPLAEEDWWPRVVTSLLRRWSGGDLSVDRPNPRELRKALLLIANDPRPARGALALAQEEVADHTRTKKEFQDVQAHRDRLLETNHGWSGDIERLKRENADLRGRLEHAEGEVVRMQGEADRAVRDASQEVRQSTIHGDNRVGRLAFRVTNVLDRETEELKLYLERREPNITGALRRVGELERLRDEVRAIRDEVRAIRDEGEADDV
jgi:hypothetical protein